MNAAGNFGLQAHIGDGEPRGGRDPRHEAGVRKRRGVVDDRGDRGTRFADQRHVPPLVAVASRKLHRLAPSRRPSRPDRRSGRRARDRDRRASSPARRARPGARGGRRGRSRTPSAPRVPSGPTADRRTARTRSRTRHRRPPTPPPCRCRRRTAARAQPARASRTATRHPPAQLRALVARRLRPSGGVPPRPARRRPSGRASPARSARGPGSARRRTRPRSRGASRARRCGRSDR